MSNLTNNQLFELNTKLKSITGQLNGQIIKADKDYFKSSLLNGFKVVADITKDSEVLLVDGYAIPIDEKQNQVISTRTYNRHTIPRKRLQGKQAVQAEYCVLFKKTVDIPAENAEFTGQKKIQYWAWAGEEVVLVHELDSLYDGTNQSYPEGYYLAVYGSNFYPTRDGFLDISLTLKNVFNTFGSLQGPNLRADGGIGFQVSTSGSTNIVRLPKPVDYVDLEFLLTGTYIINEIEAQVISFAPTPITPISAENPTNPIYPEGTETRILYNFTNNYGGFMGGGGTPPLAIYEFSGLSLISESGFLSWNDATKPKIFRDLNIPVTDLYRPLNDDGRIYVKRYQFPTNQFTILPLMVPLNEDPGPAYPYSNKNWTRTGPNGVSDATGLIASEPILIFDGRDYYLPPEDGEWKFPVENLHDVYLSSYNKKPIFFCKEKHTENQLKPPPGVPHFREYSYKELEDLQKVTNRTGYINPSLNFFNPPDDPTSVAALQYTSTDFKWFLLGLEEYFKEVYGSSPNPGDNEATIFQEGCKTRNIIALDLKKGFLLTNDLICQFSNLNQIQTFVEDTEETTFDTTVTFASYSITTSGFWDSNLIDDFSSTVSSLPFTKLIKLEKPQKLIEKGTIEFIDIVPLIGLTEFPEF